MFVGLDLSLRETGCAHLYRGRFKIQVIKTRLVGSPRLDYLEKKIMGFMTGSSFAGMGLVDTRFVGAGFVNTRPMNTRPFGVAIEDYAMGAKGRVFSIGELGGIIRLAIYRAGIPMVEVPPTVLKKFTTGKGNASKIAMVKKVSSLWHDTDNDNVADAVALAKVAAVVFGRKKEHSQFDYLLKNCVVSDA